jgi:hypothetical protein
MADSNITPAKLPGPPAPSKSTGPRPFYAAHCNINDLARIADEVVVGTFSSPPHGKGDDRRVIAEDWLRWAQSDEPKARLQWAYLNSKGKNRDDYVLALWSSISRKGAANRSLRDYIETEHAPWTYYERHFFGWFLSRFNLGAARQVCCEARLAAFLHYAVAGMAVLLTVLFLNLPLRLSTSLRFFLPFSLALVALCFLSPKLLKMPYYAYAHSLIPRLAATMAIGYLFLASAPQLVKLIYQSQREPWQFWTASALFTVAALIYIVLHIARRIHPVPRLPKLFRRGSDLLVLAVAYAAIELWPAAPILFSNSLLFEKEGGPLAVQPSKLVFCAVVALNLGVLLQLAWDEKPLTEPL